jgi:hypothetical protein
VIGRTTYNIVRVEGLGQRSVGDVVVNAVIDEVALTSSSLENWHISVYTQLECSNRPQMIPERKEHVPV